MKAALQKKVVRQDGLRRETSRKEVVIEHPAEDNEGLGYRIGKRPGVSRVKCAKAKRRREKV